MLVADFKQFIVNFRRLKCISNVSNIDDLTFPNDWMPLMRQIKTMNQARRRQRASFQLMPPPYSMPSLISRMKWLEKTHNTSYRRELR